MDPLLSDQPLSTTWTQIHGDNRNHNKIGLAGWEDLSEHRNLQAAKDEYTKKIEPDFQCRKCVM